jgi:hypothetical protein
MSRDRESRPKTIRLWIARKANGAPLLHTLAASQRRCWGLLLAKSRKHLPGLPGVMGSVTKREARRGGIAVTRCEMVLPPQP